MPKGSFPELDALRQQQLATFGGKCLSPIASLQQLRQPQSCNYNHLLTLDVDLFNLYQLKMELKWTKEERLRRAFNHIKNLDDHDDAKIAEVALEFKVKRSSLSSRIHR